MMCSAVRSFVSLLFLGSNAQGQYARSQDDPARYPGPVWMQPKIHHSPSCLWTGNTGWGWHDVAGAITFQGAHHVFMGCPDYGGWSHAASEDLVHWEDRGIDVKQVHETYKGMDSNSSPCSGFVAMNDEQVPCAGFRQCDSTKGTTELNSAAESWDVPLEVRCAKNSNLTEWGDPEYLFPFYFYRKIPYDPVRPWKDNDGKWYVTMATDGCNATTRAWPCSPGGQLELFTASSFKGPWTQLAPMFTTNMTKSGMVSEPGAIWYEFVTPEYFGGLSGDPANGSTRVIVQNNNAPTFWVGNQSNGGPFQPLWDHIGAVGHYDYGSLTMARTFGSGSNQVAVNGRRVLVGWIREDPASQSLARDLSLSNNYELLQQFVPELATLRKDGSHRRFHSSTNVHGSWNVSMQMEVVATFTFDGRNSPSTPFGLQVLGAQDGTAGTCLEVDCSRGAAKCIVGVNATTQGNRSGFGPLLPVIDPAEDKTVTVTLHAFIDRSLVEAIFNNRTAMVVKAEPKADTDTTVALYGFASLSNIRVTLDMWELVAIASTEHDMHVVV